MKKSQAILKCFIDHKYSVWFTLGSEGENMFCDTWNFFISTAGQGFKTLNDGQSYILSNFHKSKQSS